MRTAPTPATCARRSVLLRRHRYTRAQWDAIAPEAKLAEGERRFVKLVFVGEYDGDPRAGTPVLAEVELVDVSDEPLRCAACHARFAADAGRTGDPCAWCGHPLAWTG